MAFATEFDQQDSWTQSSTHFCHLLSLMLLQVEDKIHQTSITLCDNVKCNFYFLCTVPIQKVQEIRMLDKTSVLILPEEEEVCENFNLSALLFAFKLMKASSFDAHVCLSYLLRALRLVPRADLTILKVNQPAFFPWETENVSSSKTSSPVCRVSVGKLFHQICLTLQTPAKEEHCHQREDFLFKFAEHNSRKRYLFVLLEQSWQDMKWDIYE